MHFANKTAIHHISVLNLGLLLGKMCMLSAIDTATNLDLIRFELILILIHVLSQISLVAPSVALFVVVVAFAQVVTIAAPATATAAAPPALRAS